MRTTLDYARDYFARGWSPVPILYKDKKPWHNGHSIKAWGDFVVTPDSLPRYFNGSAKNIGILLGAKSNGLTDADIDVPEAIAPCDFYLPPTASIFGRAGKPRSHREYICDPIPSTLTFVDPIRTSGGKHLKILEIRSTGLQTVFPGSVHERDEPIEWAQDGDPANVPGDLLVGCAARAAAAALLIRHWPGEGVRHDASLALCGGLLKSGWDVETTHDFLEVVVTGAGDPEAEARLANVASTKRKLATGGEITSWGTLATLIDAKVIGSIKNWLNVRDPLIVSGTLKDEETGESFGFTDLGNSNRLVYHHGIDLRYCHAWSKWLVWEGDHWEPDSTGHAVLLAKDTVRGMYSEAGDEAEYATRAGLAKHATKSENVSRITAMLSLAQSHPKVALRVSDLDEGPMLFNVRNGTIDLKTGRLRSHDRNELLTKVAPVTYDENATALTWVRFLKRVVPDLEIRQYLQRAVGYSLSGSVVEQCLFFLYGLGSNGKSTFINTLMAILGEYAFQAPSNLLLAHKYDNHPTELASLFGVRFLALSEVEQGKRLAESLTKQLTGGDAISARRMREDFWAFHPTHKIWMGANHRPRIVGTDDAIWRRIHIVPFTQTIPEEERDSSLVSKLRAEGSGILRWALEGCDSWQKIGLNPPDAVKMATKVYRDDQDVLRLFIDERCEVGLSYQVTKTDFYAAYKSWCDDSGEHYEKYVTKKEVGSRMIERGFDDARTSQARSWLGIRLRSE